MKHYKYLLFTLLCFPLTLAAQDYILWNGGVGADEREMAPDEGTKLVFFAESGSFLANVQVSVSDASGREQVNTTSNGPWLILDLPPGQYQVRASLSDDNAQGGTITVTGSETQEFSYRFQLNE